MLKNALLSSSSLLSSVKTKDKDESLPIKLQLDTQKHSTGYKDLLLNVLKKKS
jgi:hypothetical protein